MVKKTDIEKKKDKTKKKAKKKAKSNWSKKKKTVSKEASYVPIKELNVIAVRSMEYLFLKYRSDYKD